MQNFSQFYMMLPAHCLVGNVFANGPGDLGSTPGRVIPKTLKMVLDTSLLNTQQYKERIKGKVEHLYMNKVYLLLNNLQWLICHKTRRKQSLCV